MIKLFLPGTSFAVKKATTPSIARALVASTLAIVPVATFVVTKAQ